MKQFNNNSLKKIFLKNKIKLKKKDKKNYLKLFKFINFLKHIEESLEKNYHPFDQMKCPIHFCNGQECVPAALNLLLTKGDYLFSHHRSHGYYLSKNCPPEKLFAELHGKETGANGGMAGSQDISFEKNKFFSGAILAGAISIAVGAALSLKLKKSKNIVACGFGESATDQGVFWESLNYSSLSNLPLLFLCENNNLSVFTPQNQRQSGESISTKSKFFGVKSSQVFGNDPVKVYDTIKNAIKYIKKYKKPYLVEALTFRTISHVGPLSDDPSGLRNSKNYSFWIKNNPRDIFKKKLIEKNFLTNSQCSKLEKQNIEKIKKYFKFAKNSKFPKIKKFEDKNFDNKQNKYQKLIPKLERKSFNFKQNITQVKGY
jgi:TPP-dependent pyruvate/acetoin dehydrogenase alpha subunit